MLLPSGEHDKIWQIQEHLNFPREVFGVERARAGETNMPEITERYAKGLTSHMGDRILEEE